MCENRILDHRLDELFWDAIKKAAHESGNSLQNMDHFISSLEQMRTQLDRLIEQLKRTLPITDQR